MGGSLENYRDELCEMCALFVTGSTLYNVSVKSQKLINTVRARRAMLLRIGVKIDKETLPGRGYGVPVYTLGESLGDAVTKIDRKIADDLEKKKTTKKTVRVQEKESKGKASRFGGYGIESWLFITSERSTAYKLWCESWTEPGQREKR